MPTNDRVAATATRAALALLRGTGVRVRRLGPDGWVVQRPGARRRLRPVRVGSGERPLYVVTGAGAAREPARHQVLLGSYLERRHLDWVIRELDINCVIDVGANRGQFATRLRGTGYRGRIVSFEPVPHVVGELRRRAAADPDWHVHDVALGDEEGSVVINVDRARGTTVLSSLHRPSEFGRRWRPRLAETDQETIRVRRLDAVWDDVVAGIGSPRVLLKIDTQGHDLAVFRGAGRRLAQIAALQSEVAATRVYDDAPSLTEQLSTYLDAGLVLSGLYPVSYARGSLRAIEFDALLVRADLVPG